MIELLKQRCLEKGAWWAMDFLSDRFPRPKNTPSPLPFATVYFGVGEEAASVSVSSQGWFKPRRLLVSAGPKDLASGIGISQIFIGSDSCLVNSNPIPAQVFSSQISDEKDPPMAFPPADPGISIQLGFVNSLPIPRTITPPSYPIPTKSDLTKRSKRKGNLNVAICDRLMSNGKRCPFPEDHYPSHTWTVVEAPPSPKIAVQAVMLGHYSPPPSGFSAFGRRVVG